MSEEEYVCKNCGEPWETEYTPFYVNGKCAECGAMEPTNKIPKEKYDD